jgi:hypothetical protein
MQVGSHDSQFALGQRRLAADHKEQTKAMALRAKKQPSTQEFGSDGWRNIACLREKARRMQSQWQNGSWRKTTRVACQGKSRNLPTMGS